MWITWVPPDPLDRKGDDELIGLNILEAILKENLRKIFFFFFFPESDWISAIVSLSSSYSQEMICFFLQCLQCP